MTGADTLTGSETSQTTMMVDIVTPVTAGNEDLLRPTRPLATATGEATASRLPDHPRLVETFADIVED